MMSAAEEDAKDADWVQRLRSEGPVPMQTPEECAAGWSSPPGHNFLVRGPDYLTAKTKIPADDWLLKPLAFDWIKSSAKIHEVLRHPNGRVRAALEKVCDGGGVAPFVWAFNLQVPSKDNYSAIAYFVSLDPIPEDSLMARFLSGDDSFRGSDGESEEEADDGEKQRGPADSTAFGRAFRKIMKKKLPSTTLTEAMGPMLCAHKQLVTKKLEEAITERKAKSKSKREKQALREKGHTIMAIYPVAKDRELIKLATKGVVKLFNAVSKAQSVQEAAKTSKESEVKEVAKRSKSTFLAILQGGNGAVSQTLNMQQRLPDSNKEGAIEDQPGWSALRDSFMLGKSRLKDWDTKQDGEADLKGAESSDDESFNE